MDGNEFLEREEAVFVVIVLVPDSSDILFECSALFGHLLVCLRTVNNSVHVEEHSVKTEVYEELSQFLILNEAILVDIISFEDTSNVVTGLVKDPLEVDGLLTFLA